MTAPKLHTIKVSIYAPDDSSPDGHRFAAEGRFDIDLNEALTRDGALELLGRFLVTVRDEYDWQQYGREQMVAVGEFPAFGHLYANGLGQEVEEAEG